MDGTVYLGDKLIGEMDKTLDVIRNNGKRIVFLTNNSSKSADEYSKKLTKMGLFGKGDEIYTSGMATADYINAEYKGRKVYLLGTDALKKEFLNRGIRLVEDEQPDICVLAFDTETTYEKLAKFNMYIKKGAYYIATHPDLTCPAPEVFIPDVGSFIEFFRTSAGRYPDKIIGKPYQTMAENLTREKRAKKENFVMVGDRLYTDIKFGVDAGFYTILVLSGETDLNDLKTSEVKPSFVLENLNIIKEYLD